MTTDNQRTISRNPDLDRLLKMSKPTFIPPVEIQHNYPIEPIASSNHYHYDDEYEEDNNDHVSSSRRDNRSNIENLLSDNLGLMGILAVIVALFSSTPFLGILASVMIGLGGAFLFIHKPLAQSTTFQTITTFISNKFSLCIIALFIVSFIAYPLFLLLLSSFIFVCVSQYWLEADHVLLDQHSTNSLEQQVSMPLNVRRDANNLHILLSHNAMPVLENLIGAVNELYGNLEYLYDNHPYLATAVQELIKDIHTNSILHLDNVAQEFVVNGRVERNAKQIFVRTHEANIVQLFQNHLADIKALNQSILEKKMAGFSQIGTEAERQFRDRIMELKIVLRWHIAGHHDEISATSHQTILDNLQQTTLKQMMSVFYNTSSNHQQRKQLLTQLDDLLNHFKSQSAMHYQSENNEILQLSNDSTVANMPLDANMNDQQSMQEFIDFNEQYVKQLKRHW